MVDVAEALERAHGLPARPPPVRGAGGDAAARARRRRRRTRGAARARRRPAASRGLHYGTYDYSAALGIAAPYQSLEHPVADHAKDVMQVAVAGTGIRLSDGSTNVLPIGDRALEAWRLHARLVRRSLERGFYQGWDLHPAPAAHPLPRHVRVLPRGLSPRHPPGCATCTTAPSARCSTSRRRSRALAGFVLPRPRSAARSPRPRSPPTPASTSARSPRLAPPEAHDDMSGCRAPHHATHEEVP